MLFMKIVETMQVMNLNQVPGSLFHVPTSNAGLKLYPYKNYKSA